MFTTATIKLRLIILGSIAILGICISGGMGLYRLALIEAQLEDTLQNTRYGIHLMINVSQANIHFKTQVQEWKNILIRGDAPEAFAQYKKSYLESERMTQQELQSSLKAMKESGHRRQAEIEAVIKLHTELSALYNRQIAAWDVHDPNNTQKADRALRGLDRPATEAMNALVEGMEKDERARIESQLDAARALYIQTRNAFAIILTVAVSIVALLIFTTTRSINRKIATLQAAIVNIRQRLDLTLRLPVEGSDEISLTARSVNDLLGEFQSVVSRMKNSAAHVSTASDGLAASVEQLSDSVNQQLAPWRQPRRFAFEDPPADHAIAAQQHAGDVLDRRGIDGGRRRRLAHQAPAPGIGDAGQRGAPAVAGVAGRTLRRRQQQGAQAGEAVAADLAARDQFGQRVLQFGFKQVRGIDQFVEEQRALLAQAIGHFARARGQRRFVDGLLPRRQSCPQR